MHLQIYCIKLVDIILIYLLKNTNINNKKTHDLFIEYTNAFEWCLEHYALQLLHNIQSVVIVTMLNLTVL